jgi:hypothetical protein
VDAVIQDAIDQVPGDDRAAHLAGKLPTSPV